MLKLVGKKDNTREKEEEKKGDEEKKVKTSPAEIRWRKEIPDIDKFIDSTGTGLWDGVWGANATGDSLKTSGAASSRVGVGFLCGAQAVCFGRGKDASFSLRKEDDYGHLNGVAVTAKHDIKKIFFNGKQHGMITHFHSAAIDT